MNKTAEQHTKWFDYWSEHSQTVFSIQIVPRPGLQLGGELRSNALHVPLQHLPTSHDSPVSMHGGAEIPSVDEPLPPQPIINVPSDRMVRINTQRK
jgi:hypothetical protein